MRCLYQIFSLTDQGMPEKTMLEECKSESGWRPAGEQGTHE